MLFKDAFSTGKNIGANSGPLRRTELRCTLVCVELSTIMTMEGWIIDQGFSGKLDSAVHCLRDLKGAWKFLKGTIAANVFLRNPFQLTLGHFQDNL